MWVSRASRARLSVTHSRDVICHAQATALVLEDGTPMKCKRRGLKITLTAGPAKGEGLMRRLDVSADPIVMLEAALQEAARAAGVEISVEEGAIYLSR